MKRLLLLILSLLSMTSIIMADEKANTHDDFTLKVDQLTLESQKSTIFAYKQICDDVSQDTVYAMLLHDYAATCAELGQPEAAIEAITESLNIFMSVFGERSHEYVTKLIQFASHYSRLGFHEEAAKLCTKATEITKKEWGKNDTNYITALNNLAIYSTKLGNYNKAIQLGKEALELKRKVYGDNNLSYALGLNNLALSNSMVENYEEAVKLETEALAIYKRILGPYSRDCADVLSDLSTYHFRLENYNEAIKYATEGLEITRIILGENSTEYLKYLDDLSLYHFDLGNYEEAVKFKIKGIEIQKTFMKESDLYYLESLSSLALCYSNLDNYYEAIRLATDVIEICKRDSVNHPVLISTLSFLATCYYELGNYDKAIQLEKEANQYRLQLFDKSSDEYAKSLTILALYYSMQKDYNESIKLATEALAIRKKISGVLNSEYGTLLANLAGYYGNIKNYNEAIRLGTEATKILKSVMGATHPQYITSLNNLANYYFQLKKYDTAIQFANKALEIYKKAPDKENPENARSLNILAFCYSALSNHDKAIQYGSEVLEIRKDVLGSKHPDYIEAINNLAEFYLLSGKHDEANRLKSQATEIRNTESNSDSSDYVSTMNKLIDFYKSSGKEETADSLCADVINYLRRSTQDYLTSLDELIKSHVDSWRIKEAMEYIILAMEFFEENQITDVPEYAYLLSQLSHCYAYQGNYNDAIQIETKASTILKSSLGIENSDYIKSIRYLADYYNQSGNYHEAFRLGKEAMEISKKFNGLESHDYTESLELLAIINYRIGNYVEAIRLGKESMEIKKRSIGTNTSEYADALHLLSLSYGDLGMSDKAIQLETESAEIYKKTIGKDDLRYGEVLTNLAFLYSDFETKDYDKAIQYETEAIELTKKTIGKNSPDYAIDLGSLAVLYSKNGKLKEAIQLNTEALEIVKRSLGTRNPYYAIILSNLASEYSDAKEYEYAVPLLKEFLSLVKESTIRDFSWLTSNERLFYWERYRETLNAIIPGILIKSGDPDAASIIYDNTALFAKGLLLSTEQEMTKIILENGDDKSLQLYSELNNKRQILNTQYSKPLAERLIDCDSLERESLEIERQLVSRTKEIGDYTSNLGITWHDVQNKLGEEDIAIEFLFYPVSQTTIAYAALSLCMNDTAPILTPLFTELELKNAEGIDGSYQNSIADSLIWGPLSFRLENKSHVYFSPTCELHRIGIEYLPSMERKDCYRLSSTRELVTSKPEKPIKSASLFGGIAYDSTYTSVNSALPKINQNNENANLLENTNYGVISELAEDVSLKVNSDSGYIEDAINRGVFDYRTMRYGVQSLKYSHPEVKEIFAMLDSIGIPCDTITGIQASEESFKALSGQHKSLLHISTHGFYYNNTEINNLNDRIRMTLGGDIKPTHYEDFMLQHCGLCFAGANQTFSGKSQPSDGQDDGILNALEIAQTDLREMDLVVLSACQTALGDISDGEGVFGLQRGFKKAGVNSILMSLWEVDDEVTSKFMIEFYRQWTSGKTKMESLKKAQSVIRQEYPDPKYWAAFILLDALD